MLTCVVLVGAALRPCVVLDGSPVALSTDVCCGVVGSGPLTLAVPATTAAADGTSVGPVC